MKILSIRQPWAWLIVNGYKDIENRTWKTNFRGEFLVHSGLQFDKKLLTNRQFKRLVGKERFDYIVRWGHCFRTGGIVGKATLIDCVEFHDSKWFEGPFGFVLKDCCPLPFQPMKGKLNFFEGEYKP